MKRIIIGIIATIMFAGCENHKAELAQASRDRDSLMAVVNSKDAVVNDFLGSFNEIQDNLLAITQKENMVASSASSGEANVPTKDKIKQEISVINDMMDKNKKQIADLSKKLRAAGGKSVKLEKMLADLNAQMDQKNKEVADLTAKVDALNGTVASLNTNVSTLTSQTQTEQATIDAQTKTIHTAYYTVGTTKQLRDEKVVDKEGGFLGLGREAYLKPNFNTDAFKEVDITQVSTIPVNGKDVRLISTHPADSYKLQMDDKNKNKVTAIVITDPDKFWKASKYLVVLTD